MAIGDTLAGAHDGDERGPAGDQVPGPLHATERRLDAAFAALAAIPADAFVHLLHTGSQDALGPSEAFEPPAVLASRLPEVRWISSDAHPLAAIDPTDHLVIHRAWMEACHGPDRVGRATARTIHELEPITGAPPGPAGPYDVVLIDLIGTEGIDAVLVALTVAVDAEIELQAHTPPPLGTPSFRVRVDQTGAVVGGTAASESLLGRPIGELIGNAVLPLIHPDDVDAATATWTAVLEEPEHSQTMRIRLLHGDGSWRWFFDTAWAAHDDADGQTVLSEFHDIHALVEAEQARQASELGFQAVAESLPVGVAVLDEDGRVHFANHRLVTILTSTGLSGPLSPTPTPAPSGPGFTVQWEDLVAPAIAAEVADLLRPGAGTVLEPASRQVDVTGLDGSVVHLLVEAVTVTSGPGRVVIVSLQDVTDEVRTSRAHARLVQVVDQVDDPVVLVRTDHTVVYVNDAARRFVEDDMIGQPITSFMRDELRAQMDEHVFPLVEAGRPWSGELWLADPQDGWHLMAVTITPVMDPAGADPHVGIAMREITAERAHEHELASQARHDLLTGLPNRLDLMELFSVAHESGDPDDLVAVTFLDLDNLKIVNDGLGHTAGDRLLVAVAHELRDQAREDVVFRFGGDEFVDVAVVADEDAALEHAGALLDAVARASVPGVASRVTASAGVALARRSDIDGERMLRESDAAMYVAKRSSLGRPALFDEALRQRTQQRFQVEADLQRAIEDHALAVHLQPIVSLETGTITAAEALCRWDGGSPADFVPIAEDSGLILPLGHEVLQLALDAATAVRERPGLEGLVVGVNVSALELGQPDFADRVLETIQRSAIPASDVALELTESILIEPRDEVTATLHRLRDAGISLALDDFGAGYSSLAYLRRFPLDILKLDISYTQGLVHDPETQVIVEAMVTMAHRLGMSVIAEGVETEAQLRRVEDLGVRWVQGYLVGRPAPADLLREPTPAWPVGIRPRG